jgi:hypothetical protein
MVSEVYKGETFIKNERDIELLRDSKAIMAREDEIYKETQWTLTKEERE